MNFGLGFSTILPNKRVEEEFLELLSKRKENYPIIMRLSHPRMEPPSVFLCTTRDGIIIHGEDIEKPSDWEGATFKTLKSHREEYLALCTIAGWEPIGIQYQTSEQKEVDG